MFVSNRIIATFVVVVTLCMHSTAAATATTTTTTTTVPGPVTINTTPATTSVATGRRVMPWFCLERCGFNASQVTEHLIELKKHAQSVTGVSFELYNLGENGTLVWNSDLTQVASTIQSLGLETFPMISSYPYPPQFLDWMRQLWDPSLPYGDQLLDALVEHAIKYKFSGFNVDWEPAHGNPTALDASNYAGFLGRIAARLRTIDVQLTVDVASWSGIWNWTDLAAEQGIDRYMIMDTYTNRLSTFHSRLQKAVHAFDSRAGIGMSTLNLATNQSLTQQEVESRFDLILNATAAGGIVPREIAIWDMPIPEYWWPLIDKFLALN
jgi:hypothetical protein